MRYRKSKAFSVLEIMLSMALFALLMALLVSALRQSQRIYRTVQGSSDADSQLKRVAHRMRQEIAAASRTSLSRAQVPAHLAGGADGDAVWFLSDVDRFGRIYRKTDGTPFWQNNVIYYLVVPANHASLYGFNCQGVNVAGYEDACPHKVLIRKVIDNPSNGATNSAVESTEDELLSAAQMANYLTQPNGLKLTAMSSEPGAVAASVMARALLTMRVYAFSPPAQNTEVRVDLRAVGLASAQREMAVGRTALSDSPHTAQWEFSISPALP